MVDIRLPNITATDPEGKMSQMQSYMHQLVEQLNWALATVDNAVGGNTSNVAMTSQNGSNSEEKAVDTFNSIKALIIKSADIVQAYEETIKRDFNGEYFADSDFGDYLEKTNSSIEENSKGVTSYYTNVQKIEDADTYVKEAKAYIRHGELFKDDAGIPVYGVEVGKANGDTFDKYARFTSSKLSFYEGDKEVAYISSRRLFIQDATFLGSVQFSNKYTIDSSDGLAFIWNGG